MYLTLSQIKYKVEKLARIIEAPEDTLPTFGHSEQTGRPHIEIDSRGYHYVIAERGTEFKRDTTSDPDELLYHIFKSTTFEIACKYEVEHRNFEQDFRRILFKYQEELLWRLSPIWGERRMMEHAEILQQNPFKDEFDPVSAYAKELIDLGYLPEVRLKMIMEKFPPPKRD
jgi:hypothetical protein